MSESNPASFIAHWPGQDVAVCLAHLAQLRSVAVAMGFTVSATQCQPTICTNCENKQQRLQANSV